MAEAGKDLEPQVKRFYIPIEEFNKKKEQDKLSLIEERLRSVGLTPSRLLFCGVNGALLEEEGHSERKMTFAVSYKKLLEAAVEIDSTGNTNDMGYPFLYAFNSEVKLPAVIVYDKTQLTPQYPKEDDDWDMLEEWVHTDGRSVDSAIQAIFFFVN